MVYAALSAGSGGVAYRVVEGDWGKESRDAMINEVIQVNQEVRQIRDYLAMGFPRPIVTSSEAKIQATCIDAGTKGKVVILINHDVHRSSPEMPPSAEVNERKNVTVSVTLPDDFTIGEINEIRGSERLKVESVEVAGNRLDIKLPTVGATKILLIKPGE